MMILSTTARRGSLLCSLAFALLSTNAALATPAFIPVQLFLTDAEGAPVNGNRALTLTLYDAATGGTALFAEAQTISVQSGLAVVQLGAGGGLALSTFRDNAALYLGLRVGSDDEMVPRFSIGTVPFAGYAEYAGEAATLEGLSATDFRLSSEAVAWSDLQGVPSGLDDGDDVYTAGAGLELTGGELSVQQSVIEGWAQDVCYDTASEVLAAIGPLYSDDDARAAMGTSAATNPLHHDRYSDAEAVTAMGTKADGNDLNHDRYTDSEATTAAKTLSIATTSCVLSGYVNAYDEVLNYTCPTGQVMTGLYSVHDNGKEDRIWKVRCCDLVLQ